MRGEGGEKVETFASVRGDWRRGWLATVDGASLAARNLKRTNVSSFSIFIRNSGYEITLEREGGGTKASGIDGPRGGGRGGAGEGLGRQRAAGVRGRLLAVTCETVSEWQRRVRVGV